MKINKTVVVMTILILWAIFSIGFICVTKVNEFKLNQMRAAAQQGYQQAVIEVANAANKCEQTGVPLNVVDKDNKPVTVTIVGVECLKQAQNNAASGNTPAPAAPTAPKK